MVKSALCVGECGRLRVPIPVLATIWIDAMKDGECNYLENRAYAGKEPDKGAAALRNY
jgi:hypothetical protein